MAKNQDLGFAPNYMSALEIDTTPDAASPTHKLQCASYTPFDKDQSPFDQPFVPRVERMDADLALLAPFVADGLVVLEPHGIRVSTTGRLLIRNICMCFDIYLRQKARQQQFSRVI